MPQEILLTLPPERQPDHLPQAELRKLVSAAAKCPESDIAHMRFMRMSFDARRNKMHWRAMLEVWFSSEELPSEPRLPRRAIPKLNASAPSVAIVGSGPAGLFCALELLRKGIRPIVFERGAGVDERKKSVAKINRGEEVDPDSNYCFGEGGAGTFSDGKLYARSKKRGNTNEILADLVAHGAPKSILWAWRPHLGSNRLPVVVKNIRETIQKAGGEVHFHSRVQAILTDNKRTTGVQLANGDVIPATGVVLAAGHSALDSLLMARDAGAELEPKGFAMGVRLEGQQAWVDAAQYHALDDPTCLPPAFFELSAQIHERGVYSFCMCPGGWIVPCQTQSGSMVTNGMSLSKRDSPFANSAIVVGIEPRDWCGKRGWRWGWPDVLKNAAAISDHPLLHEVVDNPGGEPLRVSEGRLPVHTEIDPLFGIRLQVALEVLAAHAGGDKNKAPAQRTADFISHSSEQDPLPSSYLPGLTRANFHDFLPKGIALRLQEGLAAFDHKLKGIAGNGTQIIGVETRTSSPVRIARDSDSLQASGCAGLYPCGEGAGFAGGIVSAAVDGVRVAHALSSQLAQNASN